MEIRIGVRDVAREVVIDTPMELDQVKAAVAEALTTGAMLELSDAKGRIVLVPGPMVAYVDCAGVERSRVGFTPL